MVIPVLTILQYFVLSVLSLSEWKTTISSNTSYKFDYYWTKCAGSGHASLALRADWQMALEEVHYNLGIESIRFHGILDDDVGSFNGPNDYSFINIDKIYDYMLSIGVHPYIELSYMPDGLASNPQHNDHHYKSNQSPPKSWVQWYYFIANLTQHLVDRYDATYNIKENWFFEVWNEPDLSYNDKTFASYLSLYANTSKAIKSVNSQLKVGGPATAFCEWIDIFLNATSENNLPVDFVSSHMYPTDYVVNWTENGIEAFKIALQERTANITNGLTFYLSEYDSGHGGNTHNLDNSYSASFMIFMAKQLQDLSVMNGGKFGWMSWWAISDIFEEGGFNSVPFNNGYGMQTIRGIKKPIYRAMELLWKFGSPDAFDTVNINEGADSVMVYCSQNEYNNYTIFAANWNYKTVNITKQDVSVIIDNDKKIPISAFMYRIDANNTNPYEVWLNMGSPEYPTNDQMNKLKEASELISLPIKWNVNNDQTVTFNFTMPVYSIVVISVKF